MEHEKIVGLTAELKAQLRLIERVYQRLQARLEDGLETPAQRDSIAYQIHNLYCAAEDLLQLVAHTFENQIGAGGNWHRTLLLRLSEPVTEIRPAFLSEETFEVLNQLRGFRHFVRHGYGAEIEINQLKANLALVQRLQTLLPQDLHSFLMRLSHPDR